MPRSVLLCGAHCPWDAADASGTSLASPFTWVCVSSPQLRWLNVSQMMVLRCTRDVAADGGTACCAHGEHELETLSCQVVLTPDGCCNQEDLFWSDKEHAYSVYEVWSRV